MATVDRIEWLWWLGVGVLIVGGLIPPITRYAFGDEDEDDENGANGEPSEIIKGGDRSPE